MPTGETKTCPSCGGMTWHMHADGCCYPCEMCDGTGNVTTEAFAAWLDRNRRAWPSVFGARARREVR